MSQPATIANSTANHAMTAWLDVLRAVVPPTGVLLIGAGAGTGSWVRWLQGRGVGSADMPVYLVEGDEQQYQHLQRNLGGAGSAYMPWRDVVAPTSGAATFHRASNPAESGLLSLEHLRALWPNLSAANNIAIKNAVTLDALQSEAGVRINWLILDCLPAAALLQGGAELLQQLDVVLVRVTNDLPPELSAHQQAADQVLHAAGLCRKYTQPERHPALAHALYVREPMSRAQEVLAANEAAQQAQVRARRLQEQLQAAQKELEQARKQVEVTAGQLKAAEESWAADKAKLLESPQVITQACQGIIHDVGKQFHADLSKEMSNAVKQIEAFVSIQNYLCTGEGISGFHGWPISPDIGLFLVELIRERHHDLVIEFGSGTSTVLFAKTLQVSRRAPIATPKPAKQHKSKSTHAFEHDLTFLRRTQLMLKAQGIDEEVSLNHAPLAEWQDDTGKYLHYDCENVIASLGRQLAGKPKRVLVLVDGPPGATCRNARYPAVPQVFKYLARHEIDVVLDDANRPEEEDVVELWRGYWKRRSIRMAETIIPSEKGLYWARNWTDE